MSPLIWYVAIFAYLFFVSRYISGIARNAGVKVGPFTSEVFSVVLALFLPLFLVTAVLDMIVGLFSPRKE